MTINSQAGLDAVHVSTANRLREIARPLTWPAWSDDFLARPVQRRGPGGYTLAWLTALVFTLGLVGLAVLPSCGVAVPSRLVLVCGGGCVLLILLTMFRSRPWQQSPVGDCPSPAGRR
jgi:hypothetical protein